MSDATMEVTLDVAATGKKVRPYEFTAPAFVWGDALQYMNENVDSSVRRGVAKDLDDVYDGTYQDDETEVTINPTAKNTAGVVEALNALGLEVDLESIPQPEKTTSSSNGTPRKSKEPTYCLFSGEQTGGGQFRPGYDMKMRGHLIRIVENTDLGEDDTVVVGTGSAATEYTVEQAIDKLANGFNWYTEEELRERRQKAFDKIEEKETARVKREQEKAEKAAAKASAKAEAADDDDED